MEPVYSSLAHSGIYYSFHLSLQWCLHGAVLPGTKGVPIEVSKKCTPYMDFSESHQEIPYPK
jgi:hypothetical protein